MYFTHLLEGPCEPAQELLQKYEYYLVIVVLSENMSKFVFENVGAELRRDDQVLCWILQHKHFESAPKGSTLNSIHEFLQNNNCYSDIEHSFLAIASRDDLIANSGGEYIYLHLKSKDNEEDRKEKIKNAVVKALSFPKSKHNTLGIGTIISAGSLIAALIGLIKK